MVQTAAHLGREIQGKTIVLTGAMVPYKFGSSDGFVQYGQRPGFRPDRCPRASISL